MAGANGLPAPANHDDGAREQAGAYERPAAHREPPDPPAFQFPRNTAAGAALLMSRAAIQVRSSGSFRAAKSIGT